VVAVVAVIAAIIVAIVVAGIAFIIQLHRHHYHHRQRQSLALKPSLMRIVTRSSKRQYLSYVFLCTIFGKGWLCL
jgi:hypothetical protein